MWTRRRIQEELRRKTAGGEICTARPVLQMTTMKMISYKGKGNTVDLSSLNSILFLDEARMLVKVEPLVPVGRLSEFLNARGFSLPVVPELDELTVGGLVCGYGIETSSHKYGLFMESVVNVSVLTATGKLVHCSPESNADLFHALSWRLSFCFLGSIFNLFRLVLDLWVLLCVLIFKSSACCRTLS